MPAAAARIAPANTKRRNPDKCHSPHNWRAAARVALDLMFSLFAGKWEQNCAALPSNPCRNAINADLPIHYGVAVHLELCCNGGISLVAEPAQLRGVHSVKKRWRPGFQPLCRPAGRSDVSWGRPMARLLQRVLRSFIQRGTLRLTTARGTTWEFGDGSGKPVVVRFTTPAAERAVLLDPELAVGECYMNGTLVIDQGTLADLLELAMSQEASGKPPRWARPQWMF